MNFIQIKHPGSLKAYVCIFHTQMNGTSMMDELSKKYIILGEVSKMVVNNMFKFRKLIEGVAKIIKIAKSIEADDPKRKFGDALQQWALREDRFQGKSCSCRGRNVER